jgi:hypothetical protein
MTYAALGHKADTAVENSERAETFVANCDMAEVSNNLKVVLARSQFGDGSQQVCNALTSILQKRLPDLLIEALDELKERSRLARQELMKDLIPAVNMAQAPSEAGADVPPSPVRAANAATQRPGRTPARP